MSARNGAVSGALADGLMLPPLKAACASLCVTAYVSAWERGNWSIENSVGAIATRVPPASRCAEKCADKVDASSAKRVAEITLDTGSRADFLDLSNHGTGPVTLASPGQLVVNAEITLFNQAGSGVSSRIECSLEANPGGLPVGTSQIVTVVGATGPDWYANMSLTGAVGVPAGTYGVDVLCQDILRDGGAASNPKVRSASMTVLAVPD